MAGKRRQHDEAAWRNAKTICRLNTQQLEMARTLGMNPRKLPRLRPGPQERWKLPVGAFIEECYRKRFGTHLLGAERASLQRPSSRRTADAAEAAQTARRQAEELVCYLSNLADDLGNWLARGNVAEVLPEVSEELREIANALVTGAPVSAIPEIPVPAPPPRASSLRKRLQGRRYDDEDDIPF